jgi:serine/threonine protein kinase
MVEVPERVGRVVGGKYRIESLIQEGGMSTVYCAIAPGGGKKVAVKVFHKELVEDEDLVLRFFNEATGTSRLHHRNIVDILDAGKDEDGTPYFVMEYLEGEALYERLQNKRILSLKEAADIMIQILDGLQAAHDRGITHRDIKPTNIFIVMEPDGSEVVKILDFGIARFRELEEENGKLTVTGTVLGTPEYMSLEQSRARRDEVDHRSDIYSCGVILYRCLTGINPFKGETHYQTISNINKKVVPPPSSVIKQFPPEVDRVVMKAIRREKRGRYQNCREFIEALKVFYTVDLVLTGGRVALPIRESRMTTPDLSKSEPSKRSKGKFFIAVAVALLLAAALGLAAYVIFF